MTLTLLIWRADYHSKKERNHQLTKTQ